MRKPEILSDEELAKAVWGEWNAGHLRVAQAQRDKGYKKMLEQIRSILNQMVLEQCDPDVMPYFTDYYWMFKETWQALQSQLEKDENAQD